MLTWPVRTRAISPALPSCANSAQCGQVSERYSITFSRAAGLPMRKPPSGVRTATRVQSCATAARPPRCAAAAAAGRARAVTAAKAAKAESSRRLIASAADRPPEQRLEVAPEADIGLLRAVDDEGRRAGRGIGLLGMLGVIGDPLQVARIGQALVDLLLGHAALAEEGVDPGLADQSRGP